MKLLDILVLSTSIWFIANTLVYEEGPGHIIEKFRYILGVRNNDVVGNYGIYFTGRVLVCTVCTGFWISILVSIAYYFFGDYVIWFLLPFSLAGLRAIIDSKF